MTRDDPTGGLPVRDRLIRQLPAHWTASLDCWPPQGPEVPRTTIEEADAKC